MRNIDNLTIHRFRGLRDLTLEDLGQINLLVGVNNSGKTSVLEAIYTYCNPLDPLEWINTAWRREIKFSRKSKLESLKWLFPQNSDNNPDDFYQGETFVSGSGNFGVVESKATYEEFEGIWDTTENINEEYDQESLIDEIDIDNNEIRCGADLKLTFTPPEKIIELLKDENKDISISKKFKIWENQPLTTLNEYKSYWLLVDTVTPFSHRIEQLQIKLLTGATFQGFKEDVLELISIMDSEIIDLEILSPTGKTPRLYINHKTLGIAPLSAFGDGVRRLLFMALTIAKLKDGILLIDELETAIHTEALLPSFSWLVKWCRKMNVQLFATTHSLETVDAILAASESENDLVLYRLEQQNTQTQAVRLDQERLGRLREELGQEVRW
ncbi:MULTISPECIES: ATP/GTP-binding protein [Okeania]|uniref:ATPase n=1 Tax=Okeania hirsuta TaxID=1458930 RepID=A0A3N6PEK0_9CYAN|nr:MULTISPECIES: ATP-binding protein [Okeania]NES79067.1 AAA family ATPase [Okeania sp. SIO1H4]NET22730.1 AAA family ATPase [Okeania sp. SIO1H5]NET79107.1 AAA family ATPase [Okeania sp. SIO1F9]NET96317.1 AAA family ATPase [Okeania sp. SIO1H2]RQH46937.1 ATPase [Okeania hirsuta]